MSQLFTCISCQVAFQTAELQREHMKSDWHRYNLKRKVIDLPPVSAIQFSQKLQEVNQSNLAQQETFVGNCPACKKVYTNENQYKNHCNSKKHLEKVKSFKPKLEVDQESSPSNNETQVKEDTKNWKIRLGQAKTEREIDEILNEKMNSATRLTSTECLFCTHNADSFELNLDHMAKAHSFFIPDMEYMADLPGLIGYLADKIAIANVCIFCNGKGRALHSIEAVRAHMIDKSHCKIPYDDGDEDDIAEYYNFEKKDGNDWEDVDGSEVGSDEEIVDEDWESQQDTQKYATITEDETQMILPSGIRIGNRQFRKYWKQNIKPQTIIPGSMNDPEMLSRLSDNYKLLGYTTEQALMRRQMKLELKVKIKSTKARMAHQQDFTARVGQKHNMLQHHYREQNPF